MSWDDKKGDIKTPYVNENCIGCSACVAICGEVFDLDDEWKAFAKEGMNSSNAEWIDDAIASCPVDAIHYKD
jgi:ferredoxin